MRSRRGRPAVDESWGESVRWVTAHSPGAGYVADGGPWRMLMLVLGDFFSWVSAASLWYLIASMQFFLLVV